MVSGAPDFVAEKKNSRLDFALMRASSVPVYRIIQAQIVATICASALCVFIDGVAAYSAFLGGLTCVLPAGFMAWRFARETADPAVALANLVRGEVGKLLLTGVMLVVIFLTVEPLAFNWFLVGLVVGLLCNAFVPLADALRTGTVKNKTEN